MFPYEAEICPVKIFVELCWILMEIILNRYVGFGRMGVLFTVISATGIRSWILRNLPHGVAHGTGIGIGLFLLLIAANGVGLVIKNPLDGLTLFPLSRLNPASDVIHNLSINRRRKKRLSIDRLWMKSEAGLSKIGRA